MIRPKGVQGLIEEIRVAGEKLDQWLAVLEKLLGDSDKPSEPSPPPEPALKTS